MRTKILPIKTSLKIFGRDEELQTLSDAYHSQKAELGIVYGRRRVGKSFLIKNFANNLPHLFFEGIEGGKTPLQIEQFVLQLKKQINDSLLQKAQFSTWNEVFDYLSEYSKINSKKRLILFFDEFQWMAAGQSKLVALLKHYWDNYWKDQNIFLILCGSIASFMVKKVIRSKALYGRVTLQMQIRKLTPREAYYFFKQKRSKDEALKYLLTFGGVPKYLEDINLNKSFEQNINDLFFKKDSLFLDEFTKVFNVHFKEPRVYLKIIQELNHHTLSLEEVAKKLKMSSSGGVKTYLENLELAEFIQTCQVYDKPSTKYHKYRISDEFLWFYIKYILSNIKTIQAGGGVSLLKNKIIPQWDGWFGLAFEKYCVNNAILLAKSAGFADKVESFGPYYRKGDSGVQIDLIYKRTDQVITVCEIKYKSTTIKTDIIPELNQKIKRVKFPRGYTIETMLIAPHGASDELKKTEYFHHVIDIIKLFQ